jgi:hypothetical protein
VQSRAFGKQKSPERLRGPGSGSERYCASSPPRPNAQGPRRTSGDPSRSVSYVVAFNASKVRGRAFCSSRVRKSTPFSGAG